MEILCKSDEQSQARLSYAMTQPKFSKEIWSQTFQKWMDLRRIVRLNPCCNGIWSQTHIYYIFCSLIRLNPCCNGIWSQTREKE